MLLQQNLDEIATGTTSEQIAYLLVERARLMDELEAMESRASLDTPDGPMTAVQLFELLEQERQVLYCVVKLSLNTVLLVQSK